MNSCPAPGTTIQAVLWQKSHRIVPLATVFAGFSYAVWTRLYDNAVNRLNAPSAPAFMPDTEENTE
jgi:hypothetical protein